MTLVSTRVAPESSAQRILLIRGQLTAEEKQEVVTICDHLAKFKILLVAAECLHRAWSLDARECTQVVTSG